jgi:hypothetical protein
MSALGGKLTREDAVLKRPFRPQKFGVQDVTRDGLAEGEWSSNARM